MKLITYLLTHSLQVEKFSQQSRLACVNCGLLDNVQLSFS